MQSMTAAPLLNERIVRARYGPNSMRGWFPMLLAVLYVCLRIFLDWNVNPRTRSKSVPIKKYGHLVLLSNEFSLIRSSAHSNFNRDRNNSKSCRKRFNNNLDSHRSYKLQKNVSHNTVRKLLINRWLNPVESVFVQLRHMNNQ